MQRMEGQKKAGALLPRTWIMDYPGADICPMLYCKGHAPTYAHHAPLKIGPVCAQEHSTFWNPNIAKYVYTSTGATVELSDQAQRQIMAKYKDGKPLLVKVRYGCWDECACQEILCCVFCTPCFVCCYAYFDNCCHVCQKTRTMDPLTVTHMWFGARDADTFCSDGLFNFCCWITCGFTCNRHNRVTCCNGFFQETVYLRPTEVSILHVDLTRLDSNMEAGLLQMSRSSIALPSGSQNNLIPLNNMASSSRGSVTQSQPVAAEKMQPQFSNFAPYSPPPPPQYT